MRDLVECTEQRVTKGRFLGVDPGSRKREPGSTPPAREVTAPPSGNAISGRSRGLAPNLERPACSSLSIVNNDVRERSKNSRRLPPLARCQHDFALVADPSGARGADRDLPVRRVAALWQSPSERVTVRFGGRRGAEGHCVSSRFCSRRVAVMQGTSSEGDPRVARWRSQGPAPHDAPASMHARTTASNTWRNKSLSRSRPWRLTESC